MLRLLLKMFIALIMLIAMVDVVSFISHYTDGYLGIVLSAIVAFGMIFSFFDIYQKLSN
jgi:hypothetical protein